MDLNTEIRKIVEYQNSILPKHERKSKDALEMIIEEIIKAYEEKTYNFSGFVNIALKQDDKIRNVKKYEPFSSEEILCIYLKRLLDKTFHVKYPNRNVYMRGTFDVINALKDMSDFTIFKFDFLNFFNSISSEFVYYKYLKQQMRERYQSDLLLDFVQNTKYAYAGLNTSNIICEIIAKKFDEVLRINMNKKGIIFYKRYIDDGLIIFNQYVSNSECLKLINESIKQVFYSSQIGNMTKCKTKLNDSKVKYIAKRNLNNIKSEEFDFLGYQFVLKLNNKGKTEINFGITQKKIDKYTKRINKIVKEYKELHGDMELMRNQIKAFSHRVVYRVPRYKTMVWKSKGFISNYCELRNRMDRLTPETKRFLQDVIIKSFANNGVDLPYFMKSNKQESIYNLYNNMLKYKTLLLVDMIGLDFETLKKLCRQVSIGTNDKNYNELVREYLIKVKVGH